jgi:hypothetical protein
MRCIAIVTALILAVIVLARWDGGWQASSRRLNQICESQTTESLEERIHFGPLTGKPYLQSSKPEALTQEERKAWQTLCAPEGGKNQ